LHGDPDDRVLGDDEPLDRRADRDRLRGLARLDDLVDLLGRDAEQLQARVTSSSCSARSTSGL